MAENAVKDFIIMYDLYNDTNGRQLEAREIDEKIRQFLAKRIRVTTISEDIDIFRTGIVNSLIAMQLVLFIENEFGIEIEDGDLDIDNFRTIGSMIIFVLRKVKITTNVSEDLVVEDLDKGDEDAITC